MTDLATLSAAELTAAYKARSTSPVEVVKSCFDRVDRFDSFVNALVLHDRPGALKAARESEQRWLKGKPLSESDGIPATIKDNIAWAAHPNRQGSRLTSSESVDFDAPAVARLKEAGCILLGKTTMPEFGWKGVGDSPLTGITRNPWNLNYTTGGSSAGAAAAAATGIGVYHLGTDGAGSNRIPASFTGVVGFKPSYGCVPVFPSSVMGPLAHIGPLTRSVRDAAMAMSVISGPDARDPFAWNAPARDYCEGLESGIRGLRIGWSPTLGFAKYVDPEVARITEEAAKAFSDLGASVEEINPDFTDPWEILNTLWSAGATLAMRSFPEGEKDCDPGFADVARRGANISGPDVIEALVRKRPALANKLNTLFGQYDLLVTPQMATTALPAGTDYAPKGFGGLAEWPEHWSAWSPFTYLFNIAQSPAISVPCGFSSTGMPIGLQIVGPYRADGLVLRAAHAFEQMRPFKIFLSTKK